MIEVPSTHSFAGTAGAWNDSRTGIALREGMRFFGSAWAAGRLAPFAVAHWALETGDGSHEYCGNVGNIRAYASQWRGAACRRGDAGSQVLFRAYPSVSAGARDYLAHVWRKVPGPLSQYLVDLDAMRLYRALVAGGYTPGSPEVLATFQRVFDRQVTR